MSEPVKVPARVLDGLEHVRSGGETNMFDRHAVQVIANRDGFWETVVWIDDNPRLYATGIFHGFEAEEEV